MSIFSGVNNPGLNLNQFTTAQYTALSTLSALTDPGADRIFGWDHADNGYAFFTIGSGLTYTHSTHTLSAGASSGVTVGSSTITGGSNTNVLYNNSGVLGEYTVSGSGNVAMTTSPVFTTPNIGASSGTSISLSAATNYLVVNNGGNTGTFTASSLTGARVWTFPDAGGTIPTLAATQTWTGENIFTIARTIASSASAVLDDIKSSASTTTISGGTNITTATGFNKISILQPTYSAGTALTITNAATVFIANAPAASGAGPATITNAYALWVNGGLTRFDGHMVIEGVTSTGATGTGNFVFDGTPTLITPVLGAATATSITSSGANQLSAGSTVLHVVPTSAGATGPTTAAFNSGYTSTAVGDLVYLDSSATWQKADNSTSAATKAGFLAIALTVTASGAAATVALPGSLVFATAWNLATVGAPVYMGTAAGITLTAPTTTDTATRVIGWVTASGNGTTKIWFQPSPDYITHV